MEFSWVIVAKSAAHPVWELFVGRRRPWVSPVPGAKQFEGNPDI